MNTPPANAGGFGLGRKTDSGDVTMAVLGSILFKRTLKQFLNCKDLSSDKGIALTGKLRQLARDSLEHLIRVIPETSTPHSEVLKNICLENVESGTEALFLKNLEHDVTEIRSAAASILSQSAQINPGKLFKQLHATNVSKTEIIDILGFQRQVLQPEQIITNALKLDGVDGERLLKLAQDSEVPLNPDSLEIDPSTIENSLLKIMLLRYFAQVEQAAVAGLIFKFITDGDKAVIIEALKALKNLKVEFDVSALLPHFESLPEIGREMAIEIFLARANPELAPKLAPWTTGKSDEYRKFFIKLFVMHVTKNGLESFLRLLERQEKWGRDRAIICLQNFANDRLFSAARLLISHDNNFVRDTAQQIAAQNGDP